jgi:hypothetical protein
VGAKLVEAYVVGAKVGDDANVIGAGVYDTVWMAPDPGAMATLPPA